MNSLSFDLHVLTARLDRAADRILTGAFGLSYRRFLALLLVGELQAPTQRVLAENLGVTEPSVSRMTGVLVKDGLLDVASNPSGGNRRQLRLTAQGRQMVDQCRQLLEREFGHLVDSVGVPYADYARHTRLLLSALDQLEHDGRGR